MGESHKHGQNVPEGSWRQGIKDLATDAAHRVCYLRAFSTLSLLEAARFAIREIPIERPDKSEVLKQREIPMVQKVPAGSADMGIALDSS